MLLLVRYDRFLSTLTALRAEVELLLLALDLAELRFAFDLELFAVYRGVERVRSRFDRVVPAYLEVPPVMALVLRLYPLRVEL